MNNNGTTNTVPTVTTYHAPINAKFGLLKYILLSMITFGLYGIYSLAKVGDTLNITAGRYDGKRTMNFWLLFFIIGPITFGIGYIVWFHKMSARLGREMRRRGIATSFGAGTFWLWNVIGSIIVIGPFVYLYKLFHSMNKLVANYNQNG